MSALPIRKTGTGQPLPANVSIPKTRLRIKRTDDSDTDPSVSFEVHAKANFPDNPRAQELEVKLRRGLGFTPEERAEFREIVARDSERLLDFMCGRIIEGIFKSRKK